MLPNKHAHSQSVINPFPLCRFVPTSTLCTFPPVQRWTSRAWSSRRSRVTAWTASATARKRTITASKAAPATPATQPHIPTDCSHTTVRTPRGHPSPCQPTIPPSSYSRPHSYLQTQTPPIVVTRLESIASLLVPPPRPHQEANGAQMPLNATRPLRLPTLPHPNVCPAWPSPSQCIPTPLRPPW